MFSFWTVLAVALGACLVRHVRRAVPLYVWLAGGLLLASVVFVNTETPRFRVPLDPFVILLAGAGTGLVTEHLSPRRRVSS